MSVPTPIDRGVTVGCCFVFFWKFFASVGACQFPFHTQKLVYVESGGWVGSGSEVRPLSTGDFVGGGVQRVRNVEGGEGGLVRPP